MTKAEAIRNTEYTEKELIEREDIMKKYYAIITKKDGSQFTIGGYSEREIQKDLKDIHKSGFANLDEASVEIYSINI